MDYLVDESTERMKTVRLELKTRLENRAFFVTDLGHWGTGFYVLREEDLIVILQGTTEPTILRPALARDYYEAIGPANIPGLGHEVARCSASGFCETYTLIRMILLTLFVDVAS